LFVRRETLERAGWFDEWLDVEIGISMFEDTWLGWRARRMGARTAFCPDALVHHAVFPRGWRDYVAERRRLRYFPALAAQVPELHCSSPRRLPAGRGVAPRNPRSTPAARAVQRTRADLSGARGARRRTALRSGRSHARWRSPRPAPFDGVRPCSEATTGRDRSS